MALTKAEDWVEYFDMNTMKIYYVNSLTGQTRWTMPKELVCALALRLSRFMRVCAAVAVCAHADSVISSIAEKASRGAEGSCGGSGRSCKGQRVVVAHQGLRHLLRSASGFRGRCGTYEW